jgi:hypothetical protein
MHRGDAVPLGWVDNDASPTSQRHVIEANTIALLSNATRGPVDPASPRWLGTHAGRQAIQDSGLWNVDFAYDSHQRTGLDVLEARIRHVDYLAR